MKSLQQFIRESMDPWVKAGMKNHYIRETLEDSERSKDWWQEADMDARLQIEDKMQERRLLERYHRAKGKLSKLIFEMPDFSNQSVSDRLGNFWLYHKGTAKGWARLYEEIAFSEYGSVLGGDALIQYIDKNAGEDEDGNRLEHVMLTVPLHNHGNDVKYEYIKNCKMYLNNGTVNDIPQWMSSYMEYLEKITILTEVQLKAILEVGIGNSIEDYYG